MRLCCAGAARNWKPTMIEPRVIDIEALRAMPLPQWNDESSKADYGKLLLIAGSRRLPGAALLCAKAALRSGCGTVRLAAPQSVATLLGIAVPELMIIPLPETEAGTIARTALPILQKQFASCDAAVLGPGIDADEETDELLRELAFEIPLPTVIDAQAIIALGDSESRAENAARVWTPHEGELEPFLGQKFSELGVSREEFAGSFASGKNSVLVFKGRETLIASPAGELWKNTAGTRGMGTAGSGDTLSGIIGALLAQGMNAAHAATWGVHIHAVAGEAAAKELGDDGMMASDFLERIPGAVRYLRKATSPDEKPRAGLRRV